MRTAGPEATAISTTGLGDMKREVLARAGSRLDQIGV
jgi:hypothetical protein